MTLVPLPWQDRQWRDLSRLIDGARLPHALMLAGPGETGKQHFGDALTQRMLCHTPIEGVACGQCKNCQLFESGSHPDFIRVVPEEQGKAIKVDEIRRLGEFAGKTASQGGWRVISLAPAEAMNTNAANAFLKTLEEPGDNTLLLVISHQPSAVLPTIRSRCRILSFPLPSSGQVRKWLSGQGVAQEQVEEMAALAGGKPLRALRYLESDLLDHYRKFQEILDGVDKGRVTAMDAAKGFLALPEAELVEWFQQHLYDLIYRQQGEASPFARQCFEFLDALNRTRGLIQSSANPNRQLLWEEVLLQWQRVVDLRQSH